MEPAKLDLEIYQGSTFTKVFQWKLDGTGVDISGATFIGQARISAPSDEVVIEFSTTEGTVTIENATDGKFKLKLEEDFTEGLDPNIDLEYDLKINLNQDTYTLLYGEITITPTTTKQFQP